MNHKYIPENNSNVLALFSQYLFGNYCDSEWPTMQFSSKNYCRKRALLLLLHSFNCIKALIKSAADAQEINAQKEFLINAQWPSSSRYVPSPSLLF